MNDEEREITDDMLVSELTVGEFKQLLRQFLSTADSSTSQTETAAAAEQPKITIRKSLDEFMSDLSNDS